MIHKDQWTDPNGTSLRAVCMEIRQFALCTRGRPRLFITLTITCGTLLFCPLPAGSRAAKMAAIRVVSQAARLLLEREVFMLKEVPFGS